MRTVISRRSASAGLLAATVAGSLLLGATGCGGESDAEGTPKTPENYKVVAGEQLCGGAAMSGDAARALKVITGSSRFEASAEEYTLKRTAADIVAAFPAPTVTNEACRVYLPIGTTPRFELKITWRVTDPAETGDVHPKFRILKMGEEAVAAADSAYIEFACKSDRLSKTGVGHIEIGAERGGMPTEPEGDVEALKDAYATVAHSVSLAMAKELGCEDDGGLPAQPVLDPA
jgi:hypothetical protein